MATDYSKNMSSPLDDHCQLISDAIAMGKRSADIVEILSSAGVKTTRQNFEKWLKRRTARISRRVNSLSYSLIGLAVPDREPASPASPASSDAGTSEPRQSENSERMTKKAKEEFLAGLIETTKKELLSEGYVTPLKK